MNRHVERYRQSWRLRIPADPGETRRIERWLATARVFLAASTLVAIRYDPTELGHSWAAYGLFVFYMANGILILMLLRRRERSTAAFRFLVHCGDILWPAVISVFAEGPRTPFFLFFFFALAAAAYRWGLWETMGTAVAEAVLLWIESFVVLHVWPQGSLPLRALTGLHINVKAFEPEPLLMLSVYLIVMGILLGYLAEQQKHLRAEKAVVTGILSRIRVEAGLTGTIEQIFDEVMSMYGASRVMLASQEIHSESVFVGELLKASKPRCRPNFTGWNPARAMPRAISTHFRERSVTPPSDGEKWTTLPLDSEGTSGSRREY